MISSYRVCTYKKGLTPFGCVATVSTNATHKPEQNMTQQQISSIRSAIADCNRYIAKESARDADLRPAETAKLLDWYIAHRAKLLAMLATA